MELEGKTALITGGANGIGAASVRLFASEGARVFFVDRDESAGRALESELNEAGRTVRFAAADVGSASDVRDFVQQAEEFGGALNVVFNNAGIEGTAGRRLADLEESDFDALVAVNLKGVFLGMKYGIPALERAGGGAIVNTASLAGLAGVPGFAIYAATKGGVVQLTKTAALEYAGSGIRVNCVCPGFVVTNMTSRLREVEFDPKLPRGAPVPMGRGARPEEIAAAACYLASDRASFVTGVAFPVDGGSLAE